MNMKLINRGKEAEIHISGKLDSGTSKEAEQILQEAAGRFDRLVLDLHELTFISSAGLRVLKVIHLTMRRKGGSLVLKEVSRNVMEVFELTGFAGFMEFM